MVVGDVGADEEDDIGGLHVGVGAGRTVGAEGEFVAGDRRGHAESGVAVVIASAKAELNEFAEGVELLGKELPGTHNAERFVTVSQLDVAEAFDHGVEGLIPGDWCENAVLAEKGLLGATWCGEDVVLGEALGAELAAVNRVIWIAACGDGLVVAHAQKHAATDGTVATGGLDPLLRNARRSGVTEVGIFAVRVLVVADVDANEAFELSQ